MTRKVEDQARWLADKFASQDKKIASLQTRGELAYSSIEDGAIVEKDLEGNLVASVGKQHDGSHVAVPYTGPTPAAPVAASLKAVPGVVEVRWSGKFTGNAVSAMDFKHVSVHVSTTPAVDATPSTQVATIRGELGDVATVTAAEGMLYVVLVAWSTAGKASAPSPVAAVAVPGAVDEAWIQDKLDDIDERYDGVITDAGNLGTKLATAESEITAAKGRLDDAAADITSAFGMLGTVDARIATAKSQAATDAQTKADAAKAAAITAAALTAQAKADNAKSEALTGAATDAQQKADTAEAAALAAAKTYADAEASGAGAAALAAAKTDATTKANDAKAAAISAAAADATAKAAQAKTDATTIAANDATAKSNNAQATAITAAATDATAKAGQAKTDAIASATTMTNGIGKNLSSIDSPTTFHTAPKGSMWRRTDGSGRIIGVWEQTGTGVAGAWTPRLIDSQTIDNLDVGKLSSSTAAINTLVSQKIAAAAGQFISLDVGQLTVTGSSTMAEAVITKLWTDVVNSRKITTQMLAVGAFDNLISEPDFSNGGDGWVLGTGKSIVAGAGRLTGAALRIVQPATGNVSSESRPGKITTEEGTAYRISAWAKPSAAAPSGALRMVARALLSTGANAYPTFPQNTAIAAAGQWTKLSGIVTMPANAVGVTFYVESLSSYTSGATVDWDNISATRANAGELTVDGSVKARSLESQLVLATDIIAGNPLGTHAKMNANGFRVLASADGGAPTEVIRMGTDTDDYFGVANTAGELVASITSGGAIAGQSGDFADDVAVGGTSLLETIDSKAQGLLGWASRYTDGKYWAGTTKHPYLSLQVDGFKAGRAYMIRSNPITLRSDAASSNAAVYLHLGPGTRAANVDDTILDFGLSVQQPWTTADRSAVTFNRLLTPSVDGAMSFLLSYGVKGATGRCRIISSADNPVMLTIEDIGPAMIQVGEWRDGTSDAPAGGSGGGETTPPPVVKTYDKTWNATGLRSFIGSGATYDYNTGYMYSGLSPSGYGDLSSMAVFPNLTGELSGATITGVWIYVYYDFWYQGSGGTPYLSWHGQTGLTGTRPARTAGPSGLGNWPRAAGKWVAISSSVWAGIKSGTHRGIMLGNSGGGYERYGYAHNPRIRIKYSK